MILLSSLFSCEIMNKKSTQKPDFDDLALEEKTNQDKSIKNAITLLEQGKNQSATEMVNRVLRINSKHKTASLIQQQLTKKIDQIFKTNRYHQYTIKQSDSLGSIAKSWLGNSIYFISLARHNKIDNPALINPGQIISIPVLTTSPLVKQEQRRSKANLALIKSTIQKNELERALQQMDKLFILSADHKNLLTLQLSALTSIADKAITITERKQTLKKLTDVKNESSRKILLPAYQHFIRRHEQNIFIDEFLLLFEDQSYREAAKKLIKAQTIKGFDDNLKKVSQSVKKLINKLHEEAIIFRKKQQLDDALTSWSLILLIDETNELASKYHERTLKLLERLKNL